MTVSVLIPSYRRKHYLLHTLTCLEVQNVRPDEVIIIDASEDLYAMSPDDLVVFTNHIHYIRWPEIGNVSRQRNAAIKMASGDIILFLDDDVSFDPELISNHLGVYKIHNVTAISGVVENHKYSFGATPVTNFSKLLNPHGPNLQPCNCIEPTHVICTANFSIKREVLLKIGGFDEQIFGSLDDVELGVRLTNKGFTCIHHPAPKVYHYMAKSSGARSPILGDTWSLSNIMYFQIKHYYYRHPYQILVIAALTYLRPSRLWLNPLLLLKKAKVVFNSYRNAKYRWLEGEKLLNDVIRDIISH